MNAFRAGLFAGLKLPLMACLLLFACAGQHDLAARSGGEFGVRVLSFNIRYGSAPDGANAWPQRRELVFDVIRREGADFVGLQEALRFQIDAIRGSVAGYGEIGVGREDGAVEGEYSPILYQSARWQVSSSGTFWLSDTPEVAGSKSWGNEITRIVTWGRFVEKASGRAVWVFNAHFDHVSQPSREKSAELLATRIADRATRDPVIVTGDFNAGEDNPAILYLKQSRGRSAVPLVDTFRRLYPHASAVGTFNAFNGASDGPKIDYIFVEPRVQVRAAGIIRDHRNGRYPSDHYPVYAEVGLR